MSRRTKIGRIPKTAKDLYHGKTYTEVKEMQVEGDVFAPDWHQQLIEVGRDVELNGHQTPFYSFDIKQEDDSEFFILSKEGLKAIIDDVHDKVRQYYEDLAAGKHDPQAFVRNRARDWGESLDEYGLRPYYLDQKNDSGNIVQSWDYEYVIFDLVRVYRTFDWGNDFLIYSRW